jgi:hypothetical protein
MLIDPSPDETDRPHPLDPLADRHASPAFDALVRVERNGIERILLGRHRALTVRSGGNAGPAVPFMVVREGAPDSGGSDVFYLGKMEEAQEEGERHVLVFK